jgi:hypothetical protein
MNIYVGIWILEFLSDTGDMSGTTKRIKNRCSGQKYARHEDTRSDRPVTLTVTVSRVSVEITSCWIECHYECPALTSRVGCADM